MLTALAAAVFTIITFEIYAVTVRDPGSSADPIRIIEAVTAGVAFLAAGAIFRSSGGVQGLTTGAGMWLAGAIGVATGAGYFVLAAMATALAAFILAVLRQLEVGSTKNGKNDDKDKKIRQVRLTGPAPQRYSAGTPRVAAPPLCAARSCLVIGADEIDVAGCRSASPMPWPSMNTGSSR